MMGSLGLEWMRDIIEVLGPAIQDNLCKGMQEQIIMYISLDDGLVLRGDVYVVPAWVQLDLVQGFRKISWRVRQEEASLILARTSVIAFLM